MCMCVGLCVYVSACHSYLAHPCTLCRVWNSQDTLSVWWFDLLQHTERLCAEGAHSGGEEGTKRTAGKSLDSQILRCCNDFYILLACMHVRVCVCACVFEYMSVLKNSLHCFNTWSSNFLLVLQSLRIVHWIITLFEYGICVWGKEKVDRKWKKVCDGPLRFLFNSVLHCCILVSSGMSRVTKNQTRFCVCNCFPGWIHTHRVPCCNLSISWLTLT